MRGSLQGKKKKKWPSSDWYVCLMWAWITRVSWFKKQYKQVPMQLWQARMITACLSHSLPDGWEAWLLWRRYSSHTLSSLSRDCYHGTAKQQPYWKWKEERGGNTINIRWGVAQWYLLATFEPNTQEVSAWHQPTERVQGML